MVHSDSQWEFILLGVSDQPRLEMLLFVVFLVLYILNLVGNLAIIAVLCNLSCLDLCCTTSTVPQMLVNFRSAHKSITWAGCISQLYIFLSLAGTECLLLALMAYDRYVAICQPLRYTAIMSRRLCLQMAATVWLCSFGNSILQTNSDRAAAPMRRNWVDHFFYEMLALLKPACVDTFANEAQAFAVSGLFLMVLLGLILVSYSYIFTAMLRIRSAQGELKAFNTCVSDLAVVSLFYGTAISMYPHPPSSYSQDRGKMVSLFYGIIAPMLNSPIYTLRNKDVHGALRKLLGSWLCMGITNQ
uniref:Olfactory receptor n=1 Tax=Terrapene triunguis TaxID=2587831 RepID=A0A674JU25_9SAUR